MKRFIKGFFKVMGTIILIVVADIVFLAILLTAEYRWLEHYTHSGHLGGR